MFKRKKLVIIVMLLSLYLGCSNSSSSDTDDDFRDPSVNTSAVAPLDTSFSLTYDSTTYPKASSKQYAIAYYDSKLDKVGLSCLEVDDYGKPYFKLIIHFDSNAMPTGSVSSISSTVILQIKDNSISGYHNKAWKTYKTTANLSYEFPNSEITEDALYTITINDAITINSANINAGSTYRVVLGDF